MTKIIILISSLLLSILSFAQTKTIQVDIRGVNCHGGSGLCSIEPSTSKNSNMITYNTTKIAFNKMTFEIEPNNLTIEEQKTMFGKEYSKLTAADELMFMQDQDFIFDIDTLLYLDLDPAYRLLKRGTYPITVTKDKVHVTFTLSYQK